MPALKKYPDELRERAIRFALDLVDGPERLSVNAASKGVGEQLGIVPDSLRTWVQQARPDAGVRPGLTTDERARSLQPERGNRELRRAKASSERSVVERFFNRMKNWRGLASRYDKHALVY